MDGLKPPIAGRDGSRSFEHRYLMLGLAITGDFGVVLAVPALAAAWLGTRLDGRYSTKPLWLIVCLVLSAVASAVIIKRRAKEYGDRFQGLIDEENRMRSANKANKDKDKEQK